MRGRELCAHVVGLGGAEAGVEGEGLPPVRPGLMPIAGGPARIAKALMRPGLLIHVSGPDRHPERGGVLSAGVAGLSGGQGQLPEAVEGLGLAG
jgi:hypothetical protein